MKFNYFFMTIIIIINIKQVNKILMDLKKV